MCLSFKYTSSYLFLTLATLTVVSRGDVVVESPVPQKPYAFGYAAGRFPGHIDRTHSEISNGDGTVHGSYSYLDPRQRIRTVSYVADKHGFHPTLNEVAVAASPSDGGDYTEEVAKARALHLAQYARVAAQHEHYTVPVDTVAVARARARHLGLYQKIAEEHARIAHERELDEVHRGVTGRPVEDGEAQSVLSHNY